MSLETLLDSLVVPPVHSKECAVEPLVTASTMASSPGSLGSPCKTSTLDEVLTSACCGLSITPVEVREALSPEDIKDSRNGNISTETMAAFARSLAQRRSMEQGIVPAHFSKRANCKQCGSVWLWEGAPEYVEGCPWCFTREKVPTFHVLDADECSEPLTLLISR